MKKTMLFQILLCLLIIMSAFYIRYRKSTDTVPTFGGNSIYRASFAGNLTFSDLGERLKTFTEKNDKNEKNDVSDIVIIYDEVGHD